MGTQKKLIVPVGDIIRPVRSVTRSGFWSKKSELLHMIGVLQAELKMMRSVAVGLAFISLGSAFVIPNAIFNSYRTQDELGGYQFGYSGGPSSHAEHRDHLGIVRGAYNLVDANGNVQRIQYVSDALGFGIISATNLPVAPTAAAVVTLMGPDPVEETPEVQEARA